MTRIFKGAVGGRDVLLLTVWGACEPVGVMTIDSEDPDALGIICTLHIWHLDRKVVSTTVECRLESSVGFSSSHCSSKLSL